MLHGIKTNFLTDGARSIASLSTAVIGIVGTAPDAPDAAFPLGARVLITDVGKALATIGKTGTLPQALAAIADQASPVIVLVRVGVDAQDQDT
jgi:phage tail sheath protein FI